MSRRFWSTGEQVERLKRYFPKAQGKLRVVHRRVLSGILQVLRNVGCSGRLRAAPEAPQPLRPLVAPWSVC
jgi:hypothetical protein